MILLVAKEQMRYATTMEAAAADKVGKDLNLVSSKKDDKPKINERVKKVFLPENKEKQTKLKPEALTAIRDVTGSRVERLHPLKKKTKLAL